MVLRPSAQQNTKVPLGFPGGKDSAATVTVMTVIAAATIVANAEHLLENHYPAYHPLFV